MPIFCYSNNEKVLNSTVKNVTVFLNSAQVNRSANFSLDAGTTDLIFEGISPFINSKSIQVKGTGKITIIDVKYRILQPEIELPTFTTLPPKIINDIKLLEDSLNDLSFDIDDILNKKEVLNLEKNVLLQNKFMKGSVDTIPELKDAMSYLRKQLNDINAELNKLKRIEFKLNSNKSEMQQRLNTLKAYNNQKNPEKSKDVKHQVVVTVSVDEPVQGKLNINYMVTNAGWNPEYDIRAEGTDKPVTLVYKANVYQNSGEKWENVKLKLSTINPNQSYAKPNLGVLYLNYLYNTVVLAQSRREQMKEGNYAGCVSQPAYLDDELEKNKMKDVMANYSSDYTQAQQTMTNVEYDINLSYTIPSDGQYHKVAVQNYELATDYYHYLLPRIDKQAYLVAKITDWGKLDLLAANANIYFEGTYVGETSINPSILQDTMEISLGKDRGIIVERVKDKDNVRNELIGSNVKKTIQYNIKLKNNKLQLCNLVIEDQIPISQNNEIIVKDLDLSSAEYNKLNGILTWKAKLKSQESKTISFSYEIEYNKNKQLASAF
ncbi:MAG: hypothetical protein A2033_10710 [Bacteroidetes bacterium GWA2_31_9]|nr:MAG: hypothetical protein A2033_10710 [Bacteroidetes bacterium GWA2_31_9]